MDQNPEVIQPQKTEAEVAPIATVSISQTELDDLKHKAEVSSQNFERAKKAEGRVKELEPLVSNQVPSDEVFSDEGKAIVDKYVGPLKQTVADLEDRLALKDVQATYPDLKGLSGEFDEFRKEYPRHKLENVAKLFLTEKGLLDAPRKGLEKATGGTRTPFSSAMTTEDSENLRKTNYKKWKEMLQKDQLPTK